MLVMVQGQSCVQLIVVSCGHKTSRYDWPLVHLTVLESIIRPPVLAQAMVEPWIVTLSGGVRVQPPQIW